MDHRDEFTKWMEAVEEALKSEGKELAEDIPKMNGCGCSSWDCPACFPHQAEVTGMYSPIGGPDTNCGMTADLPVVDAGVPEVCASCGHELDDSHTHEPDHMSTERNFGLEEISNFGDELDAEDLMQAPMEEDPQMPQKSESLPRSSDGRGVKLGDIVQKTEYRKVGQESPLTHGGELEEAGYEQDDDDDFSDLGHYEPRPHEMSDYNRNPYIDDPVGKKEYDDEMAGGPKTEKDVEDALDMISIIKNIQREGTSQASRDYSEDELANMQLPQLRKVYTEVTGNTGVINMENIDPDVAAMLKTLQSYDKMIAESNKKPDFLDVDKDGDKKEPWKKAEKEKTEPKKEEVKESKDVDPEVLEWMARLAKVAR